MVAALDESVRQLVTSLKRKGLYQNSVIIFTTDNGAAAGGLDMSAGSNFPLRGVKNTLWEGGVRGVSFVHSPLIKRGGNFRFLNYLLSLRKLTQQSTAGRVYDGLVHASDWLPTMFALAGGTPDSLGAIDGFNVWEGISLGTDSPRYEVLHGIDPLLGNRASLRVGDYKILVNQSLQFYADWYKRPESPHELDFIKKPVLVANATVECNQQLPHPLLHTHAPLCNPVKKPCLFNIKWDPCEYHNLADFMPNTLKVMLDRLNFYSNGLKSAVYPMLDNRANPDNTGGVWIPWRNNPLMDPTQNDFIYPFSYEDQATNSSTGLLLNKNLRKFMKDQLMIYHNETGEPTPSKNNMTGPLIVVRMRPDTSAAVPTTAKPTTPYVPPTQPPVTAPSTARYVPPPTQPTNPPYIAPVQNNASFAEPAPTVAPYVEPVQTPAPYVEPVRTPAPYVEPVQTPAPYVEPVQTPAPYVKNAQSSYVQPAKPVAPLAVLLTTVAPQAEPAPTVAPYVEPVTSSTTPYVPTTQPTAPYVAPTTPNITTQPPPPPPKTASNATFNTNQFTIDVNMGATHTNVDKDLLQPQVPEPINEANRTSPSLLDHINSFTPENSTNQISQSQVEEVKNVNPPSPPFTFVHKVKPYKTIPKRIQPTSGVPEVLDIIDETGKSQMNNGGSGQASIPQIFDIIDEMHNKSTSQKTANHYTVQHNGPTATSKPLSISDVGSGMGIGLNGLPEGISVFGAMGDKKLTQQPAITTPLSDHNIHTFFGNISIGGRTYFVVGSESDELSRIKTKVDGNRIVVHVPKITSPAQPSTTGYSEIRDTIDETRAKDEKPVGKSLSAHNITSYPTNGQNGTKCEKVVQLDTSDNAVVVSSVVIVVIASAMVVGVAVVAMVAVVARHCQNSRNP